MKTIKQRVMASFLWLIITVPIVVMLLFNISMRVYTERAAKRELVNTSNGIETLVRQQIAANILENSENETVLSASENLKILRSAFRASKFSANTEFLIVNSAGVTLFPQTYDDSFLNSEIVQKAKSVLSSADENEIIEFRVRGVKYYATYKTMGTLLKNIDLVFISNGYPLSGVTRIINLMLLIITAAATGISVWIAVRLSKSISKPITELSGYARQMGEGAFLALPENQSSFEIHELTESLSEMSKRLSNYDRTQKAFLQNASHELRTPLMSIHGYAEGIAKGIFADSAKTAEIICEESRRLNTLVEELLTLSRIDKGI